MSLILGTSAFSLYQTKELVNINLFFYMSMNHEKSQRFLKLHFWALARFCYANMNELVQISNMLYTIREISKSVSYVVYENTLG